LYTYWVCNRARTQIISANPHAKSARKYFSPSSLRRCWDVIARMKIGRIDH